MPDVSDVVNEIAIYCYRAAMGRWQYTWLRAETDLDSFAFEGRYVDADGQVRGFGTDEIEPSVEELAGIGQAWKTLVIAVSRDQRVQVRFDYESTNAFERSEEVVALFDQEDAAG